MRAVGLEPVDALPPGLLAECRPHVHEARIDGRNAQRPAGGAFMARVLDVVVGRVDLACALERVLAARVRAAEAAGVHLPCIQPRLPVDDPFRDEAAHAARSGKAVSAKSGRDPEAADLARAEDELAVGGERFGTVDEPDHLRVL